MQLTTVTFENRRSKFYSNHKKRPVLESLFSKVAGLCQSLFFNKVLGENKKLLSLKSVTHIPQ